MERWRSLRLFATAQGTWRRHSIDKGNFACGRLRRGKDAASEIDMLLGHYVQLELQSVPLFVQTRH